MRQEPVTHEMLEAILGAIDEGIHVVDAKGVTIYYNHVAAKLDGLSVEEVMGHHLLEVFPSLNVETSTLLRVIENGDPIYHQHQRYTNKKGNQVITVNTTLPIRVDGQLVGAVEVAKDISKVKELSEKLVDLQAQIAQKTQMPGKKKQGSKGESGAKYRFTDLISQSRKMEELKQMGEKAAQTPSPILIMGETGTGKELVVQSIHNASPRSNAAFIAQNCAALPTTLLEGILFGTTKGSFTGAEDRPGLFELADGGTLFLDEINSMPLELQAKLLRVIQESRVRRVGGMQETTIDVRIIAALNEDPQLAVRENRLRSDLFYRLNVVAIPIPPLRERKEDIPILIHHFIQKFNYLFGKLVTGVSKEAEAIILQHEWPGNVRELEHTIEAAMNLVEGDRIERDDLPFYLQQVRPVNQTSIPTLPQFEDNMSLPDAVKRVEEEMIRTALAQTDGNIMQAAKQLGIPRQTLQYKLSKLDS
ncbi:sigma-54-dependent Fis family transcriptional regulator [Ammoniphilus sp. CFH 90114]|uniref:sigma-54 interaction domain-containing protein n=1 Tax=Ammoniphilus sp. CFH 90114 TaxID=2493665 RepID=UPI00100D9C70|nr:sigma 54-interacting transcriptional regulator [Ammoniphilus sp. CFH 90114]RXT08715.1 PAS domain S-box protein [Ammoniphilus sp. CFH 90114]